MPKALKYQFRKFAWIAAIAVILVSGCRSTKYVPSDKYLLNSVKIKNPNSKIKKNEFYTLLKQKPNKRLLGLKFYLNLYNLSNLKKEKGINKYLRKLGEEPSIYEPYLTERTVDQFKLFLKKKGYYNAVITDSVKYHKRKANLVFHIKQNKPYLIQDISYNILDTLVKQYVFSDTVNTLLKRGKPVDEDVLSNERIRIETNLKNQGYFNFSRNYISYTIDSAFNHKANIEIVVRSYEEKLTNNKIYITPHKQYKIRDVLITTENNANFLPYKNGNAIKKDTINSNGIRFVYQENFWIKPNVILQSSYITPKNHYRISDTEDTKRYLLSLNVFSSVNLQYTELPFSDTSGYKLLDCSIQLTPHSIQSYDLGFEGTNTSGNLGGGVNLSYQHKSLFGNAEIFQFKVHGAIESIKRRDNSRLGKTLELGADATIFFPKFLLPLNSIKFVKKYNPKSTVSASYNYQQRPNYTMALANVSFGYNWKQGRYITHQVNLLEMNLAYLPQTSPEFQKLLDTTYLKYSYNNHLVPVTSYTWQYNNQNIKKSTDFKFIKINIESAGNILSGVNRVFGSPKEGDHYELFGIRYSQYVKGDIDYRYYQVLNSGSMMVYRIFAGIGYPYGNAMAMPFEKLYYSGGANSIRGWQARTIGPGTYLDTISSYPNSTGDMKLEANIEYRFKLFSVLEGALFADAGNVWAIKNAEERPGSLFKLNSFYKDIAVGSGIGLRFDFKFVLFRTDLGLKMRNPARKTDKWIFTQKHLLLRDFALNMAIAYPF